MAMEPSTGRILQEILEYLPVLKVPARERLLLKDGVSMGQQFWNEQPDSDRNLRRDFFTWVTFKVWPNVERWHQSCDNLQNIRSTHHRIPKYLKQEHKSSHLDVSRTCSMFVSKVKRRVNGACPPLRIPLYRCDSGSSSLCFMFASKAHLWRTIGARSVRVSNFVCNCGAICGSMQIHFHFSHIYIKYTYLAYSSCACQVPHRSTR